MPTATAQTATVTWEGTSVDVPTIVRELARVAREAGLAAAGGDPDRLHTTRASVMNLVVNASEKAAVDEASILVQELGVIHPSRAIIVTATPDASGSRLDAQVTAIAHAIPGTNRQLSYEEIRLTAFGELAQHVDSVVTTLLLPGVPVFIWWPGDPPMQHALLEQMVELCDRMIVDSGDFTSSARDVAGLAQVSREQRSQCAVSDLNWARLTPWRELLAQLYDLPHVRPFFAMPTRITVSSDGSGGTPAGFSAQALLLAGWLCARLGWAPVRLDGASLRCDASGRSLEIVFESEVGARGGQRALARFTLAGEIHGTRATIAIRSDGGAEGLSVDVDVEGEASVRHTAHFPARTGALLLCEELEVFSHDDVYEESLAVAGAIAARVGA